MGRIRGRVRVTRTFLQGISCKDIPTHHTIRMTISLCINYLWYPDLMYILMLALWNSLFWKPGLLRSLKFDLYWICLREDKFSGKSVLWCRHGDISTQVNLWVRFQCLVFSEPWLSSNPGRFVLCTVVLLFCYLIHAALSGYSKERLQGHGSLCWFRKGTFHCKKAAFILFPRVYTWNAVVVVSMFTRYFLQR